MKTDGKSLVPLLRGGEAPQRDYFYWELHEGKTPIQAARFGDWKVVRNGIRQPLELYDLARDPGETRDIAASHPDLVARGQAILNQAHTPDPNWPLTGQPEHRQKSAQAAWQATRARLQ